MHPDIQALLTLQDDDLAIDALEDRLAELAPHLKQLAAAKQAAEAQAAKAREAVSGEERAQVALKTRMEQHKDLQTRNTAQVDMIARPREATAAMAQLEQSKKLMAEDEKALEASNARLRALRDDVTARETTLLAAMEAESNAQEAVSAQRAEIEGQLAAARARRAGDAEKVNSGFRSKYDRIRAKRRMRAVHPVLGNTCAHCDTMVPTQRRNLMASKGAIDICEGCGVILYQE